MNECPNLSSSLEERSPNKQLGENTTNAPEIDFYAVAGGAQEELGGPVPQRDHTARHRLLRLLRFGEVCKPEICNLQHPLIVY